MPTTQIAESPLRPSTRTDGKKRRKRSLRWIKRGVLIAIAATIVGIVIRAWLPDPVVVDTALVRRMSLETEIAEDGRTRVRDRYVIAAPIHGDLVRVEIEPGEVVRAGDTLATIVPSTPQLLDVRSRDEARARLSLATAHERTAAALVAKATAAREVAAREAVRTKQLVQRGALPVIEDERATLAAEVANRDLASAVAQRDAARAEIEAARAFLGVAKSSPPRASATVTAPADGRVLRVLRESSGPIAAGTPLFELGDLTGLELVVDVLSSEAARVSPGMIVEIDRWGGDDLLHATVTRVEPAAFTRVSALGIEEQRVRVIAKVESPPPALGDGFGVAARIITWRGDNVLAVPASAVFRYRGQWSVYVVEGKHARRRAVTIAHRGRLDVEVANLDEHARVILHPGDSVHDGVEVTPR